MTNDQTPTRIVLSWLRDDAHEHAESVLLRALDEVDTTPQRRPFWSAWRVLDMTFPLRIAVSAAAVLAVPFVGLQLVAQARLVRAGPPPRQALRGQQYPQSGPATRGRAVRVVLERPHDLVRGSRRLGRRSRDGNREGARGGGRDRLDPIPPRQLPGHPRLRRRVPVPRCTPACRRNRRRWSTPSRRRSG
jgi:hypothetical protein